MSTSKSKSVSIGGAASGGKGRTSFVSPSGSGLSGPSKAIDEQDNAIEALKQQLEQERERLRDLSSSYSFSNLTNRESSSKRKSTAGNTRDQDAWKTRSWSANTQSQKEGSSASRSPFQDSLFQSRASARNSPETRKTTTQNEDAQGSRYMKSLATNYDTTQYGATADSPLTASALGSHNGSPKKGVSFRPRQGSPTNRFAANEATESRAEPQTAVVRNTINSLREENEQLSNLVDQTQSALDDERKRRQELFHKYKTELEEKENLQSEVTRLNRRVDREQEENERLRSDKLNTESQLYSTSENLATVESQKKELEQTLAEVRESYESLNTENQRNLEIVSTLREEKHHLESELDKARADYQDLYTKFTSTEKHKSTIVAQKEREESERTRLMRNVSLGLQEVFKSLNNFDFNTNADNVDKESSTEQDSNVVKASLFFQGDWSELLTPEKLDELFAVVQVIQRKTVKLVSTAENDRKKSKKRAQELENSWKRIEQLSSHLYSLQDANHGIREELKQAKEKWDSQRQKLMQDADTRSEQQLKQRQRELDNLREELKQVKDDSRQNELKMEELNSSIDRKDEQVKELEYQLNLQNSAYSNMEKERQNYYDKYQRIKQDYDDLCKEQSDIKQEKEQLEFQRDQSNKKVDTLRRNNEELQSRVDNLERELRIRSGKIQELESAKSQTELEYSQWKKRVENLETQLKDYERGNHTEKANALQMKETIKRLEDELESQRPMVRELRYKREECSNLSNEIESWKAENGRLERKLKVAQSEYEEILAQFNSEKEQMTHKEQLWDRKVREVQSDEERERGRLQHQISMLKHEREGNMERIRSLTAERDMAYRQLEDTREELSGSKHTIEALKRQLNDVHNKAIRMGSSSRLLQLGDSNHSIKRSASQTAGRMYDSPYQTTRSFSHIPTRPKEDSTGNTRENGTSRHQEKSGQRTGNAITEVSPTSARREAQAKHFREDNYDNEGNVIEIAKDVFMNSPGQHEQPQASSQDDLPDEGGAYEQYHAAEGFYDDQREQRHDKWTENEGISLHDIAAHGLGGLTSPYEPPG